MRRGKWADDYDTLVGYSTNLAIRSSILRSLGVAPKTLARYCMPGGPWQRILPGIILLHNGIPSALQRATAALMYGGPDSVLTGHAALSEHGFRSSAQMSDVLLLIPARRHRTPTGYVDVERTWRMPESDEIVHRGSLRYVSVTRAAMDAARRTRRRDTCRALLAGVIQRGDTSPEELAIELAEGSRRGTALPRSVLGELADDAHSVEEIHAQQIYRKSGLPTMVHNREIETHDGEFIASPDGWLDDVAMVWEIDSLRHHLAIADHEATVLRRARMQAKGIIVVSHLPKTLHRDPELVVRDLRDNYRLAASRPRPSVRLRPLPAGSPMSHSLS
ncbi:hypothetical protein ACWDUM_11180 [Rhodococcus sp. NPDC003322]